MFLNFITPEYAIPKAQKRSWENLCGWYSSYSLYFTTHWLYSGSAY